MKLRNGIFNFTGETMRDHGKKGFFTISKLVANVSNHLKELFMHPPLIQNRVLVPVPVPVKRVSKN
jgi:hypothetical protein